MNEADLLSDLYEEIERAWTIDRDDGRVDTLASRHPALMGELYEFFFLLMLAEDPAPLPPGVESSAARRLRQSLERGYSLRATTHYMLWCAFSRFPATRIG